MIKYLQIQVVYNQIMEQTHYLEQTLSRIIQHNSKVSFPAINKVKIVF